MEKISVIIPVYNVENYLERCVKSVLSQSYSELEIFLINDGSTDNSGIICDNLAKTDNRIIVIHKPNTGVSDTRNLGIEKSTGKYISFIDSDDYIDSTYFERLYNALASNNVQIAACSHTLSYEDANKENAIGLPWDKEEVMNGETALLQYGLNEDHPLLDYIVCKLYNADLIKENTLRFDNSIYISEDILFNCNAFLYATKIAVIPEPLYFYCRRETSAVGQANKNLGKYITKVSAFRQILELSQRWPTSDFESRAYNRLFSTIVVAFVISFSSSEKLDREQELLDELKKLYRFTTKTKIQKKILFFYFLMRINKNLAKNFIVRFKR